MNIHHFLKTNQTKIWGLYFLLIACGCNEEGSIETQILVGNVNKTFHKCMANGQCPCKNANIDGKTCDKCKLGFKPFPACNECSSEGKWGSACSKSKWPNYFIADILSDQNMRIALLCILFRLWLPLNGNWRNCFE